MGNRFTTKFKRVALAGSVTAALVLGVGQNAGARPRASFAQSEPEIGPLAPAQRDQYIPAQRGGGISLAQATSMAQSRYQGRVVRAESVQMGDRVVYEIRILGDDGRVRTVRIDAQTGSFL